MPEVLIPLPVILGQRTDAFTGETKEVRVSYKLVKRDGHVAGWWMDLENGPTGYESARVENLRKMAEDGRDWYACAGTAQRWDKLVITSRSLGIVVGRFDELVETAERANA